MLYQLPNGKVIYLSIEQCLELTDGGEHAINPFTDSAVHQNSKEHYYDFDYLKDDENENDRISDDEPFDDIIDLNDSL
jgi:hypothetical protein